MFLASFTRLLGTGVGRVAVGVGRDAARWVEKRRTMVATREVLISDMMRVCYTQESGQAVG